MRLSSSRRSRFQRTLPSRSRRRSSSCLRSTRSRSAPRAGTVASPEGGRPATATGSAGDVPARGSGRARDAGRSPARLCPSPRLCLSRRPVPAPVEPPRAVPRPRAEPSPARRPAPAGAARPAPSRRPGPSARPARRPSRGTAAWVRPVGLGAAACVVLGALALAALRLFGGGVRLDGVEPARLRVGQRATLTGSGFAPDPAGNSVLFDDREAKVLQASLDASRGRGPGGGGRVGSRKAARRRRQEGPSRVARGRGGGLPGAAAARHLARGRHARRGSRPRRRRVGAWGHRPLRRSTRTAQRGPGHADPGGRPGRRRCAGHSRARRRERGGDRVEPRAVHRRPPSRRIGRLARERRPGRSPGRCRGAASRPTPSATTCAWAVCRPWCSPPPGTR